jgi:hypothetical protein
MNARWLGSLPCQTSEEEGGTRLSAQSGRTRRASSTLPMARRWQRASTTNVPMSEEE